MHILDPSRIHVINTFSTYSNKLFFLCPWTALALSVYDEDACDQSIHSRSENLGPLSSSILCQQVWAQKQDACGLRLSSSYKTHNEKFGCLIRFFGHFWPHLTG